MAKKIYLIVFILMFSFISCNFNKKEKLNNKVLNLRLSSSPTTLNPAYIVDVYGGTVATKIFNALFKFDKNLKLKKDLLQDYKVVDSVTYIFKLKKGIKFHNGDELTSDDVIFSFYNILNPKTASPRKWVLDKILGADEYYSKKSDKIKGIVKLDKYSFKIILKEPFSSFLSLLAMPNTFIVNKKAYLANKESYLRKPIGTGPYKIVEFIPDQKIVLKKNENYFEQVNLDKIVYYIITDNFTARMKFKKGNIDILEIDETGLDNFLNDKKYSKYIISKSALNVFYLGLNCQKYPFNNIKFRQALNYAVNKKSIIKNIFKGKATIAKCSVPPSLSAFNDRIPSYNYNLEKAKKLLKESGVKTPIELKLYQKPTNTVLKVTQTIANQLSLLGIKIKVIQLEWSALKNMINSGKCDMFYLAWVADYPDAENFLTPLFYSKNIGLAGNRAFFKDKEVDKLLIKMNQETDIKTREQYLKKLQELINKKAPWIFLWHKNDFRVIQPWIKNYELVPVYYAAKFIDIKKEF